MQSKEDIKILKEQFAIPESEAWKWRVNRGEKGAVGIGRLSLKEIEETEFENAYVNAKRILKEFENKPPDFELSVGSLLILEGYRQYVIMCEEMEAKGLIILPKGSRGEINLNDEGGSSGKERES